MGKLFFLFAVMPIIEIALLIEVGDRIGGWPTIGLVILTAAVGAALVRMQGVATLFQARRKLDMGQIPGQEMVEGLMLAIAGVLLFFHVEVGTAMLDKHVVFFERTFIK